MLYSKLKKLIKTRIKRPYYNSIVKLQAKQFGMNLKVNGLSRVTKTTILGSNVNFNGFHIRGTGRVLIGDNFHSGPDVLMLTRNHNYDHGKAIPYDETYVEKEIIIEDNVWVGARVIIMGNVKICEGAIIQAGSVVVSDIPRCAIAGGHPAKVFKYRDMDHYEKLKHAQKFH